LPRSARSASRFWFYQKRSLDLDLESRTPHGGACKKQR